MTRFESGIRNALERNEYVVFYQPQMTMDRRNLVAVEALVRWNHPKLGLVPPAKFMPFLETTGLKVDEPLWQQDLPFIRAMMRFEIDSDLFGVAVASENLAKVDPQCRA
jgi:EAL domain-containing protein (putative c-di-GMP-specific phosphodiesterase class I)